MYNLKDNITSTPSIGYYMLANIKLRNRYIDREIDNYVLTTKCTWIIYKKREIYSDRKKLTNMTYYNIVCITYEK